MGYQGRHRFLFSAIVGQDKLKKAYLANIVNPRIGGLLISGPKGTGKSTIVHSVSSILPEYEAVEGCDFNCSPDRPENLCSLCRKEGSLNRVLKRMQIVNLPLSCTEDRLVGGFDIERLLQKGEKKVVSGILGQANRNILYVDEVNLLPDHLVDDILDAAAMHWNAFEREGISFAHAADFVLVGSMNPEEGDIRPQIMDRFPLCVKIETVQNTDDRAEIVRRNLLFENDPALFNEQFALADQAIKALIAKARINLARVQINQSLVKAVASSCAELKVDGQRPDIVIIKTALTLAAIDDRAEARKDDIVLSAEFALVHRTRDGGLLEPPRIEEVDNVFNRHISGAKPSKEKISLEMQGAHEAPSDPENMKYGQPIPSLDDKKKI